MKKQEHPLFNWIPYKLVEKENEVYFEWIYLGEIKFEDPFFDETILRCKSHKSNSKMVKVLSTAENLIEWSNEIESLPLKSLVFHVSRCGSTLLSQCLSTSSENIMISEGPIIDEILRTNYFDWDKKVVLLKSVLKFLGQKRFPEQKYLILKMDAWHIFKAAFFRSVFPKLPFALLYRNPNEVLKSHQKLPGMHMVPNIIPPDVFGITAKEVEERSFQQYGALVLEKYFQAFLDFHESDHNVTILNYNEGMKNAIKKFISFIHIHYIDNEHEKMLERLKKHSKNESVVFTGDIFKEESLEVDFSRLTVLYEKLNNLSLTYLEH
ncbi:sulfotransferase family protein [Flavobacterium zhairuonense]|uniref:sulfotransferase family protein n=1 Tax=Flavobacterium zhairuonense TaxID=2493631 RepID=UPI0010457055|nr:sulfotransferase family protein [Flavobacterium zhairuonense]KAF2509219.1 sulfotransferase family protein [Flavobacterium zhairuonense]